LLGYEFWEDARLRGKRHTGRNVLRRCEVGIRV
jgi:hypothetical protein